MVLNITPDEVLNISQGAAGIPIHACVSTEGWIAWVIVWSIWLVISFLILATDEKQWAVGAASFVGLIFAIGFVIFSCPATVLIILMIVLTVLGLAGGFVASR